MGMINTWLIWALGATAVILAGLTLFLYWFVICVVLYWHGARFPTGLMPWRYFRDLRDYKEIISAKGKTSTLYYLMLFLTWTTVVVLFLLAIAVWDYRETTRSLHRRPW